MNDAIILSDLHLGSKVCQAKNILNFLSQIKNKQIETSLLILNGDVFDSWDFRRLCKKHWKILSALRKLSSTIDVVWVNGNHDGPTEIVSHLLGTKVFEEYIINSSGKKILVMHGHQFDDFISDHPRFTKIADKIYRFLQKIHLDWALKIKKSSKTFLGNAAAIENKSIVYAKKKLCDAVCCGHVHLSACKPELGYYNSGSWTEVPCSYLLVSGGVVTLHEFVEQGTI